jgi:hypothetical protein
VGKATVGKALKPGGRRTRSPSYGAVRRRIFSVLEKHPDLWREGRLVGQDVTIRLPEAVWVFLHNFAKKSHQTTGEVISHFTQEYLGIIVSNARRIESG